MEKMEERKPFDEDGINGLVLGGKYLPEELIAQILFNVDCDTLLNCQLVCARWKTLLEMSVWRRKAEAILCHSLRCAKDAHWTIHYAICKMQMSSVMIRDLECLRRSLKRYLDQNCVVEHWLIQKQGDNWGVCAVETPAKLNPSGYSIIDGLDELYRPVSFFKESREEQTIDLASKGFMSDIMDREQRIAITASYNCRFDCEGMYECCIQLLGAEAEVIGAYKARAFISEKAMNKWYDICCGFRHWGPPIKKIVCRHSGIDKKFWNGYFGSKMTCASVRPKNLQDREPEPDTSCPAAERPQVLSIEPNTSLDDGRWATWQRIFISRP